MYAGASVAVIIAAAGQGSRMGGGQRKQNLLIEGKPMALRAAEVFLGCPEIDWLVYVGEKDSPLGLEAFSDQQGRVLLVQGGARRQDSVEKGLEALPGEVDLVLVHDGARPFLSQALVRRVLAAAARSGAAIPCLPPTSTIRTAEATLDRSLLFEVQTPQGFRRAVLEQGFEEARRLDRTVSDEASLAELAGYQVSLVEGEVDNIKVTTKKDLPVCFRSGIGYDVHRLVPGRPLWLGCMELPWDRGLLGHSDGDVLAHAIADALLGAAALGDIGQHFPPGEARFKGISGALLLEETAAILRASGFTIVAVDATLSCEQPRIAPFVDTMRERTARALGLLEAEVSIKATTQEGLGFAGRGEGMAAFATATVKR